MSESISKTKVLFLLVDGLGDVSAPELRDKTPLEYANTPNLDELASHGLTGLMDPVEPGLACGSDTAHMSIFGYPPKMFYRGRGAFESLGAGLDVGIGDIAFKSNFATLEPETGVVKSRRADRNFEREGPILCGFLDGMTIPGYDGYKVKVRYATEHRCGVCVSGPGLSDGITGTDPLKDNLKLLECKPLEQYDPIERSKAELTSKLINALSMEIHKKLSNHPINQERLKQGKNVANIVLLRGCGIRLNLEAFRNKYSWLFPTETDDAFTIAPTCMISGWMKTLDVWCVSKGLESCTGDFHSNLELKGTCATSLLRRSVNEHSDLPWMSDCNNKTYSFGFLHIKAVDDAGHEGRIDLKVHFIERVDKIVGKIISDLREDRETNYVLVVTGDHSTPCVYGDHSSEPVPFLISSLSSLRDSKGHIKKDFSFNEISAVRGGLGRFPGSEVFEMIKQYISVTK